MGKKTIFSLLFLILAFITAFGTGFSTTDSQVYSIKEKHSNEVPEDLKQERNIKAGNEKIGYNFSTSDAKIQMNFKLLPIDNSDNLKASGTGVLQVDGKTFPFEINKSQSLLYQEN